MPRRRRRSESAAELRVKALFLGMLGAPDRLPKPPAEFVERIRLLTVQDQWPCPPLLHQDTVGLGVIVHAVRSLPKGPVAAHLDTVVRRALAAFAWGAPSLLESAGFAQRDDVRGTGPWDAIDAGVTRARRFQAWMRLTLASPAGDQQRLLVAQACFATMLGMPSKAEIDAALKSVLFAVESFHHGRGTACVIGDHTEILHEVLSKGTSMHYEVDPGEDGSPRFRIDVRKMRDSLRAGRWGGAAPFRRAERGRDLRGVPRVDRYVGKSLDEPLGSAEDPARLGDLVPSRTVAPGSGMPGFEQERVRAIVQGIRRRYDGDVRRLAALAYLLGRRGFEEPLTRRAAAAAYEVTQNQLRRVQARVLADLTRALREIA